MARNKQPYVSQWEARAAKMAGLPLPPLSGPPRVLSPPAVTTNRVEAQQPTVGFEGNGKRVSDYILSPEGDSEDMIQNWRENKDNFNNQDIFLLWKEVGDVLKKFQYPLNKSPVDPELRGLALLMRSLIAEEAGTRSLELPGLGTDDTLAITGPEPAPPAAPPTSFAIKPLPLNPSRPNALATEPALPAPSSNTVDAKVTAPATLGVSQSNINNVKLGGLQNYMDFAKQLMPAREKRDPWMTAFEFFVNMAAESSKPGATAIGAAGTAGQQVMKTLAEDRRLERAEDLAATKMGITLASALKPKTGITVKKGENVKFMSVKDAQVEYPFQIYGSSFWQNFVPYLSDGKVDATRFGDILINNAGQTMQVNRLYRGGNLSGGETTIVPGAKASAIDVGDSQDSLIYRTKDDAKQWLISKGFSADSPGFDNIAKRMVPKKGFEDLLGKSVVDGDSYQGITFITKGGEITGANIGPLKGAAEPRAKVWASKTLKELAKNNEYIEQTFNVLPQVDRGLDILMSEQTITGKWQDFSLPFKAFLADLFKTEKGEIINQQLIQSISNVLAPKMRPKGSGSTSDMEFKAYRQAIADLGNTTLANYLTMYTFKRVAENSRDASSNMEIAISDGAGPKELKKILEKQDKGIYTRFSDNKDLSDSENDVRFEQFLNSRKRGEVIYNYDKTTGGKLIGEDSAGNAMPDFFVSDGRGSYILFR